MRLIDFAWNAVCSVSGADQNSLRLLLFDDLVRPAIGFDNVGYVISIPAPKIENDDLASVQGLYADMDDKNWSVIWRLFRASLYHAAFHVKYSNMEVYAPWLKGKDENAAVFAVSLVEDYRITAEAMKKWPALMDDIAFANYIAAMRMKPVDSFGNEAFRFACRLLLSMWGVYKAKGEKTQEDDELEALVQRVQDSINASVSGGESVSLMSAADDVYAAVTVRGDLNRIPTLPHMESYSDVDMFHDHLDESSETADLLRRAMDVLGIQHAFEDKRSDLAEFKDAMYSLRDEKTRQSKVIENHSQMLEKTALDRITFPQYDYATFLRIRAGLAGAIRNVKNSLLQYKNVQDEDSQKEAGQVNLPLAIQIIASKSKRSDIFDREEPMLKDEAWAILIDTSKSAYGTAEQVRGIAVCLAEVASTLMREKTKWAMYGFNDNLEIIKDFNESYSIESKARIGGLVQEGATLLPDAIQVVGRNLMQRPIENQFLVVISDCLPTGYPGIQEKLVETIDEVSKKGVMMIGIGVKSANVKKYFKVNTVLSTPYDMMKFFTRAYMELSGFQA